MDTREKSKARNSKQFQKPKFKCLTPGRNAPCSAKDMILKNERQTFARNCRRFLKTIQRTLGNIEDGKQLIRSSGSIAANYIEANEALSKNDFRMRIKICRKESKESGLWLRLLDVDDSTDTGKRRNALNQEAIELMKIFGSILHKSE